MSIQLALVAKVRSMPVAFLDMPKNATWPTFLKWMVRSFQKEIGYKVQYSMRSIFITAKTKNIWIHQHCLNILRKKNTKGRCCQFENENKKYFWKIKSILKAFLLLLFCHYYFRLVIFKVEKYLWWIKKSRTFSLDFLQYHKC